MRTIDRRLADLEQIVRGAFKVRQSNPVACRVYDDAAQTLTNNTLTAIAFAHERWDEYNMHDTSTNNSRVTVPVAGWYMIWGNVQYAANNTGSRDLLIRVDGTTYIAQQKTNALADAAIVSEVAVSTLYYLTAGQYVELIGRQLSGGDLATVIVASHSPEFALALIK